jgi:hypothetical protein
MKSRIILDILMTTTLYIYIYIYIYIYVNTFIMSSSWKEWTLKMWVEVGKPFGA